MGEALAVRGAVYAAIRDMLSVRLLRLACARCSRCVVLLAAGCSSTRAKEQADAQADAEQLVTAAHAAGVAPGLTVGRGRVALRDLGPQVCDALDGRGQLGRVAAPDRQPVRVAARSSITTDAVTYERLVVKTYCPDELSTYDDLVADIDPTETTS